jgi:nucleotide-binding universal stress UspA family protein
MKSASSIRHILVPHDFSDGAEYALAYAFVLSEKFDARVTVVHAYEVPTSGYPDAFITRSEFSAAIERNNAASLAEVKARALKAKVNVETSLRRGVPWVTITEAANELKTDLIVMGTHGRRGVARMLLGSVAEKVVRTAPCPVLTVHLPDGENAGTSAAHSA